MNLISIPSDKKLTKPQFNLVLALVALGVTSPAGREIRTNPFTKVSHELEPFACALYDFITQTRKPFCGPLTYTGKKVTVAQWDRARYLFLALWPDEYFDLLD